jgi:8-oxo-dGTP pyrophosphatase MutT (NUDIX family)
MLSNYIKLIQKPGVMMKNTTLPNLLEFPGGKVEKDESLKEAIAKNAIPFL